MSKVKTNKYVYQSKKDKELLQGPDKRLLLVAALFGVALIAVISLICIEKSMENKLVVKNKSSHNIKDLQFWYEYESGDVTDIMKFDGLNAKETIKESTEGLALSELQGESWLSVWVVFEDGGEALVQTGQFLQGFEGKISFEISDTKDEDLLVRIKAGEGLFNSTAVTGCDDVYYINPKDGYIE